MNDPVAYVILDCETTGLSPEAGDRIVSFAAVKVAGEEGTARAMHLVFNPRRRSDIHASRVHGLSERFLMHQRPFEDFAGIVRDFIGGDIVVGHNVSFDMAFLNAEFMRAGVPPLGNEHICTMELAKRFSFPKASLDHVASSLGINVESRKDHHDAFSDVSITYQIFQSIFLGRETIFAIEHCPFLNAVEVRDSDLLTMYISGIGNRSHGLSGRAFAVTGELSAASREEIEAFLPRIGAVYHSAVRKDTDYLIAGANPGNTKLNRAAERFARYGRPRNIDEAEFLAMLDEALKLASRGGESV